MAIFSVTVVGCTGLGPVFAGYVEMNSNLEWRWIQWIHLMCVLHKHHISSKVAKTDAARVTGIMTVAMTLFMDETRSAVLLMRMAKKMRKKTGDQRYRARVEDERASLQTLIIISLTRPFCEQRSSLRHELFSFVF